MNGIFAQRSFDISDQAAFAGVSGDANPMHMDPLAARRTQAGAPVVHGMHLTLWSLDALARHMQDLPRATGLMLRAQRMVYLGEAVTARLLRQDSRGLEIELRAGGTVTTRLSIATGTARAGSDTAETGPAKTGLAKTGLAEAGLAKIGPAEAALAETGRAATRQDRGRHGALPQAWGADGASADVTLPDAPLFAPEKPLCLTAQDVPDMAGQVAFATPPAAAAEMFPAAAAWLGARRIAALACSSRLVGMVCPGLHSIYGGLSVRCTADDEAWPGLGFRVTDFDPRFGMAVTAIGGGGLRGTVTSFLRSPPAEQPSVSELARLVGARQFSGTVALVIGGSRGLGEVTAKLLAAGGARLIITYASGLADAQRVADDIRAAGGDCQILGYDATRSATEQLATLEAVPTHLYYFATPQIARRKSGVFDAEHHARFLTFYVAAFHDLCKALLARGGTLRASYPSTVLVDEHPPELTEYAMAKLAGEVLCRTMNRAMAGLEIQVARLPRVATDQAAGVMKQETIPAAAAMLPVIERMHAAA